MHKMKKGETEGLPHTKAEPLERFSSYTFTRPNTDLIQNQPLGYNIEYSSSAEDWNGWGKDCYCFSP